MAAFDVVGINFQLRFRINMRSVAEQQGVALLVSLRFLGVLRHVNTAAEYAGSAVRSNPLEHFVTSAIARNMPDIGRKVDMLSRAAQSQPVGMVLGSAPFQRDMLIAPDQPTLQSHL